MTKEAVRILCFSSGYRNDLLDVKFATGIKNIIISFGFYPYAPMCVITVYSVLSRVLRKKSEPYYSVGYDVNDGVLPSLLTNICILRPQPKNVFPNVFPAIVSGNKTHHCIKNEQEIIIRLTVCFDK